MWNAPVQEWREWKRKYSELLPTRAEELPGLQTELDSIKKSIKKNGFITTKDLSNIMKFKLQRGKNRPGLQKRADSNNTSLTEKCTREAFELVGIKRPDPDTLKEAIKLVSNLNGVGPATSSLILCLKNPWVPFMADEAFKGAGFPKPNYTMKEYLKFAELMCDRGEKLGLEPATMVDCLWAESFARNPKPAKKKKKTDDKKKAPKKKSVPKAKKKPASAKKPKTKRTTTKKAMAKRRKPTRRSSRIFARSKDSEFRVTS